MNLLEVTAAHQIEKIPAGHASAMYWAKVFAAQSGRTSDANTAELEAAILDGAKNKFMMREGDLILGAIAFNSDEQSVHIEHLGSLAPGVGTALLQRAESFAKRKKLPVTLVPSSVALGFYTKHGYVHTGPGALWKKVI